MPLYRINAFILKDAKLPLRSGNPAAIVLLKKEQGDRITDRMQQTLAKELDLSETAFVTQTETVGKFQLRWFTPNKEVDLCGHATLASAHALLDAGWISSGQTVTFSTLSGDLIVLTTNLECRRFEMTFPLLSRREELSGMERGTLLGGLQVEEMKVVSMFRSDFDVVVVLYDENAVLGVKPDMEKLRGLKTRGVIVGAVQRDSEVDVISSRFFAPACGIDEDPVTGSAQCTLANEFIEAGGRAVGRQVSSRGGEMMLKRTMDGKVRLEGAGFVVFRGEVCVDMH